MTPQKQKQKQKQEQRKGNDPTQANRGLEWGTLQECGNGKGGNGGRDIALFFYWCVFICAESGGGGRADEADD